MSSLIFEFPAVPVSVNNLYFNKNGRRVLTTPGRRYKTEFIANRGGVSVADLMRFRPDNESMYVLELWFFLSRSRLLNENYGQDRRAKSPFKDLDVSNLIKLAEDSIAELLQVRDRNNWTVLAHKRVAIGNERMVARLSPLDLEEDPYPCPL